MSRTEINEVPVAAGGKESSKVGSDLVKVLKVSHDHRARMADDCIPIHAVLEKKRRGVHRIEVSNGILTQRRINLDTTKQTSMGQFHTIKRSIEIRLALRFYQLN